MKTYEKKVGGSFRGLERISGRVHNGDVGSAVMDAGRSMERLGIYLSKQNAEASALEQQERAQEDDLTTRQKSGILRNKLKESYISDVESKSGDERKEAYMSWREGKAKELYGSVIDEKVNDRVRGVLDNSFEEILGGYDVSQAKWGNEKRMYEANEVLKTERTIYTDDAMRHMDADYYFSSQAENLQGYSLHNKVDARSGYVKGGYDKESAVFATKYVNEQIKRSNLTGASEMIKKYSAQIPAETVKILEDSIRLEKDYADILKHSTDEKGEIDFGQAITSADTLAGANDTVKNDLKSKIYAKKIDHENISAVKLNTLMNFFDDKISKQTATEAVNTYMETAKSHPKYAKILKSHLSDLHGDVIKSGSVNNREVTSEEKTKNENENLLNMNKFRLHELRRITDKSYQSLNDDEFICTIETRALDNGLNAKDARSVSKALLEKRKTIKAHELTVEEVLQKKDVPLDQLDKVRGFIWNELNNIQDKSKEEVQHEIQKIYLRGVVMSNYGIFSDSHDKAPLGDVVKKYNQANIEIRWEFTPEAKLKTESFITALTQDKHQHKASMLDAMSKIGALDIKNRKPIINDETVRDFVDIYIRKIDVNSEQRKRINRRKAEAESELTSEDKRLFKLDTQGANQEVIRDIFENYDKTYTDRKRAIQ